MRVYERRGVGRRVEPWPREVTIVAHDIGPVGGMELHLSNLIFGLLERDAKVTVISRTCDLPPHERMNWLRVRGPARPFSLAYPWFMAFGSLRVSRNRRGVVHTTGAIVLNAVDVCTVHLCHRAVHEAGVVRRGRHSAAYRLNALLSSLLARTAERVVYIRRASRLVAVSKGLAQELVAAYPSLVGRVTTIPNGVDSRRFRPDRDRRREVRAELGISDDDLLALFVGSEWEGKGLEFAVGAVARVEGSRLAVLGAGDVARFTALAQEEGASGRVVFLGERRAPERYHAAADVFVLPSAYETFSLATHEAAASGVPLLATRVHGVDELLVDGENGWFVERNVDSIAARLISLRDNLTERRTLAEGARLTAARFSWDTMVSGYLALYDAVSAA